MLFLDGVYIDIKSKKWLVYNRVGVSGVRNILKCNNKTTLIDNIICIVNGIIHGICRVLQSKKQWYHEWRMGAVMVLLVKQVPKRKCVPVDAREPWSTIH